MKIQIESRIHHQSHGATEWSIVRIRWTRNQLGQQIRKQNQTNIHHTCWSSAIPNQYRTELVKKIQLTRLNRIAGVCIDVWISDCPEFEDDSGFSGRRNSEVGIDAFIYSCYWSETGKRLPRLNLLRRFLSRWIMLVCVCLCGFCVELRANLISWVLRKRGWTWLGREIHSLWRPSFLVRLFSI